MSVKTIIKPYLRAILLLLLCIVTTTPSCAGSDLEENCFLIAPINPAFIEYQNELYLNLHDPYKNNGPFNDPVLNTLSGNVENDPSMESNMMFPEDVGIPQNLLHPPGLRPSPVDLSYLAPVDMEGLMAGEACNTMPSPMAAGMLSGGSYPSRYDLREESGVTGVRDQGFAGTCWAHSSLASLESYLMHVKSEDRDFSENHVKNTLVSSWQSGFDRTFEQDGGFDLMTVAYLARWDGPVAESDDPYNEQSPVSSSDVMVAKHVQEVMMLPGIDHSDDLFKWAIVNYGAITVAMHNDNSLYFNKENNSYYCYDEEALVTHAVSVVGWDDDYDRNRFIPAAPGNGAYIVKNSWGENWGDKGYCYISYYDTAIGSTSSTNMASRAYATNFVITADNVSNYDRIYQYDPLGWCASIGNNNSTAMGANVFTAVSDETLKAVSFYTVDSNSLYNISIYLDPEDGPTNMSGPVSVKNGSIPIAGYHTIDLDNSVPLLAGQSFSVVITFTTPAYAYPLAIEKQVPAYSSNADAEAGQSYASSDGNNWTDISVYGMNVCIKAFTTEEKEPEAGFTADRRYAHVGETINFHDASLFSPDSWHWDFGDGATAEVQDPSHSYANPGTYNVTLTASNGFGSSVTQRTSFIRVLNSTISVSKCGTADFTLIQEAIYAASGGDTIIVEPGTYQERVLFRKSNITLRSATGNPADVRIVSNDPDNFYNLYNFAVFVMADNITLQNITVSDGLYGMLFMYSNNCDLNDCHFSSNGYGMSITDSDNNRMHNSIIEDNMIGISLSDSADNHLTNNSFDNNVLYTFIFDSQANSIDTSNTLNGKPVYHLVGVSDLVIDPGSNAGLVHLIDCSNITVKDFESTGERHGIYMYNTTGSTIENCSSTEDYYGIYLAASTDNTISGCIVSKSRTYGISLTGCHDNLIYNNFFNSTNNIRVSGGLSNLWNIPMTPGKNIIDGSYLGGNFWATPAGTGWSQVNPSTGNGFCQQYTVTGDGNNIDALPLTSNAESAEDGGTGDQEGNKGSGDNGRLIIHAGSDSGSSGNIVHRDSDMQFVGKDAEVRFIFKEEDNPVDHIRFDAASNFGYVMADIMILESIPESIVEKPSGLVYRNLEITVGDERFTSSGCMQDAIIGFSIPKEWVVSGGIDENSIRLEHYVNGAWNRLPTEKTGRDQENLYFESKTPGFSPFAICGDSTRAQYNGTFELSPTDSIDSQILNKEEGTSGKGKPGSNTNTIIFLLSTPLATLAIVLAYYRYGNSRIRK